MTKKTAMSALFEDILETLRVRGSLVKDDILSTWSLSEDEYAELRTNFLKILDVESGPKKVGGFRIKAKRDRLPTSNEYPARPVPAEGWEQNAIDRLCELLQHKELEKLS